jgi:hypothetical protein
MNASQTHGQHQQQHMFHWANIPNVFKTSMRTNICPFHTSTYKSRAERPIRGCPCTNLAQHTWADLSPNDNFHFHPSTKQSYQRGQRTTAWSITILPYLPPAYLLLKHLFLLRYLQSFPSADSETLVATNWRIFPSFCPCLLFYISAAGSPVDPPPSFRHP